MGFTRRLFFLIMGAIPSHGSTMGYVSDPFRIEEPANPGTEGVALSALGGTMGLRTMDVGVR